MKRQVALIIESSTVYGRDLLKGIIRYMRTHDQWSVFLDQRDLWKQPPAWLNDWTGDGIISRATTPKFLEAIRANQVPFVEVTDRHGDPQTPSVRSDDHAIGRMGAEHLIERGYRHFGFCGFKGEAWSHRREEAFCAAVESRIGAKCAVYNTTWRGNRTWEEEQAGMREWLQQFRPPVAVMACNDLRGQQILDVCSAIDLAVPEQVAVLGVDNDELLCQVCTPPLSSVLPNAELVGFRAAETLSTLMDGQTVSCEAQVIPPLQVTTRQSTDAVAIDDHSIAEALRYIREHACSGLTVDDVVQNTGVSRSTLERQIRKHLGRTPQQEIRYVQIKRAKELLLTTELTAERIAILCGFEHPEYLHVVFKRLEGITTSEFRDQVPS